jgi:hypothetical protein
MLKGQVMDRISKGQIPDTLRSVQVCSMRKTNDNIKNCNDILRAITFVLKKKKPQLIQQKIDRIEDISEDK